jgi:uncharacterized protein YkwD
VRTAARDSTFSEPTAEPTTLDLMRKMSGKGRETRERPANTKVGRRWAATHGLLAVLLVTLACGHDDLLGPSDPEVQRFVELMNDYRVSAGCEPLGWRSDVAEIARAHSADMVERDFFAHTNPDGASPFDRLRAAGIDYSLAAENIAYGYPTAEDVLEGWLGSQGHRDNIERCSLTQHGVGLVGTHWTHLFVTP